MDSTLAAAYPKVFFIELVLRFDNINVLLLVFIANNSCIRRIRHFKHICNILRTFFVCVLMLRTQVNHVFDVTLSVYPHRAG
jgi:hypothetical protein